MKLGTPTSARKANAPALGWAILLLLVFATGLLAGAQGWHQTLAQSISGLLRRAQAPLASDVVPAMTIDMGFSDYDILLDQREKALQAGVNLTNAADFVPATIRVGDTVAEVRIRLREGPVTNLGPDNKWDFEVRISDDTPALLGWRRFYLQDPASNNWLNQWAFTQALQREKLLTARYRFVYLTFNGKDRGLYAVQEGFTETLLTDQDRAPGVIVEFDANLLWESIAHFHGNPDAVLTDPVRNLTSADFRYFEIDTFRDATIARDPELSAQKERAIALLYALQTEQRPASAIFDVKQYGRFLALVDLWAATEGAALINLKYYYNAATDQLEPISFDANALGNTNRLSLTTTYGDPQLQAAYVQSALHVSQPEYLAQLQADLAPAWQQLQRILGAELPDPKPPWDALRARQTLLQRSLKPVRPVFAYLETTASPPYATLRIDVGNVINLPVEIAGFDIDGATYLNIDPAWVTADQDLLEPRYTGVVLRPFDAARSPVVRYVQIDIPLTAIHQLDNEIDFNHERDIHIDVNIIGAPEAQLVPVRTGLPEPLLSGATE